MDIEHQEFSTKVMPLPVQKNLDILDKIVEEEIMRQEKEHQLDLWTINVIYYTSAVSNTSKRRKAEGREREQTTKRKARMANTA